MLRQVFEERVGTRILSFLYVHAFEPAHRFTHDAIVASAIAAFIPEGERPSTYVPSFKFQTKNNNISKQSYHYFRDSGLSNT